MNDIKHRTINLPLYKSITVIDLNDIIGRVLGRTQLDLLNYYDNIEIDLSKSYCKKFFYHNFIKETCEAYIKYKDYFTLLFHYKEKPQDLYSKEIEKIIKIINKHLPIAIFTGKVNVEQLRDNNLTGEVIEECEKIKDFSDKTHKKNYSFKNITSISKRYELNFLSESYFTDLNVKYKLMQ